MIKKLSSKLVYENPWMQIREDDVEFGDGSKGIYAVLDKPDAALVIPKRNEKFILVKLYRYPAGKERWEFPCGGVQGEQPEPIDIARQELEEETGYIGGKFTPLGNLHVSYGYSGQIMHYFLVEDLTPGQVNRDQGEFGMIVKEFSAQEIDEMILSGEISDTQTIAGWALLKMQHAM